MQIRELIVEQTLECTEDIPIEKVYSLLQETDLGFVIVTESRAHRIPIGVVTEHEICEQVIGRGRDPRGLTAANVMSSKILKIKDTADITDLFGLFRDNSRRFVCVQDDRRELCGIITDEQFRSVLAGKDEQIGPRPESPALQPQSIVEWTH